MYKSVGLVLALGAMSCAPPITEDSAVDTEADTGAEDTGAEDTGAEDTGTDGPCGVDAFALRQQVLDGSGTSGTTFGPEEPLTLVAEVENTCPFAVEFETTSGCLFDIWSLTAPDEFAEAIGCDDAITPWRIEAGESLEQRVIMGALVPAEWSWQVQFLGGQQATLDFTVE